MNILHMARLRTSATALAFSMAVFIMTYCQPKVYLAGIQRHFRLHKEYKFLITSRVYLTMSVRLIRKLKYKLTLI